MGVVLGVAREVARTSYEDLSDAEVHQVKRLLLDSLGCAVAGWGNETTRRVLEAVPALGGGVEATVLVGRAVILAARLGYEPATRFTEAIPAPSLDSRGWNVDTRAAFVVPFVAGRNLRYPLGAHLGLVAVHLARLGVTGPAWALEGHDGFVEKVLGGATTRCATHTGDESRRLPANKETADHSTFYTQAAVAVHRRLGPEQYGPDVLADPRVRRLAGAVTMVAEPAFDQVRASAEVTLRLTDGTVLSRYVDDPPGHPRNPLTDDEVERKFRDLVAPWLSPGAADRVVDTVWSLDACGDVTAVSPHLVTSRRVG